MNRSLPLFLFPILGISLLLTGCVKPPDLKPIATQPAEGASAPAPPVVKETPSPAPDAKPEDTPPSVVYQGTTIVEKKVGDDPNVMEAKRGVQKQGHYDTSGPTGIITEPLSSYWDTKSRITFEIQIAHSVNLYRAANNDKNPPDLDTFIKEILQPAQIKLPDLPPKKRYIYDPEQGKIFVETLPN